MQDPSAVDDLVLLGETLLLDDDVDDAALVFLQAVRLAPGNHHATLGLGHSMLARGDVTGALVHFTDMLARDPADALAQAGLLDCLRHVSGTLTGPHSASPL